MNVYILHELYSNSVTKRVTVFSSLKKANAQLDYLIDSAKNSDNWSVEAEHFYMGRERHEGFRLTPPSKNINNIEFVYIYKKEVK